MFNVALSLANDGHGYGPLALSTRGHVFEVDIEGDISVRDRILFILTTDSVTVYQLELESSLAWVLDIDITSATVSTVATKRTDVDSVELEDTAIVDVETDHA